MATLRFGPQWLLVLALGWIVFDGIAGTSQTKPKYRRRYGSETIAVRPTMGDNAPRVLVGQLSRNAREASFFLPDF